MIRFALVLALSPAAAVESSTFRLPFDGRWFVLQGGDTANVNHHMAVPAQSFGLDFARVAGESGRELCRGKCEKNEEFYSWDQPVLSPADGTVLSVVDGLPDNPVGALDPKNPAGNHVVIAAPGGRYAVLAHLKKGSIRVKPRQKVSAGDELGRCGNSGNSDFPHVHLVAQDAPKHGEGIGQNMIFKRINIELSGKRFEKVDWPLIRGLFVWP